MARMNEDGQWIVLMGFIVSAGIFFLALIISQSTLVGQTTAEAVLEFPKTEIQDLRSELWTHATTYFSDQDADQFNQYVTDIKVLSMARQNAVVDVRGAGPTDTVPSPIYNTTYDTTWLYRIHYNNGITDYNQNEMITVFK